MIESEFILTQLPCFACPRLVGGLELTLSNLVWFDAPEAMTPATLPFGLEQIVC